MSNLEENTSKPDVVERSTQIRDYVEQLVTNLGEHPEVELKSEWHWKTPKEKAECILDMQATANSEIAIGAYRLIVIGVREDTRMFVGCDHSAFDDVKLHAIFDEYLDPAPEFEVLRLTSSTGQPFVVLRIPRQTSRPIVTRKVLGDDKKTYIRPGEIWVKPGAADTASSGKRQIHSRAELINMFELEHHIETGIRQRLDSIIPVMRREIAAQFSPQAMAAPSPLTATDEEIESFLMLEFAEGRASRWRIWIEQLREHTWGLWSALGRRNGRMTVDEYRHLVLSDFRPVMDRLLLTGMLTIKYDAGVERFQEVVDLMIEIFGRWRDAQRIVPWRDGSWNEPPEIVSESIPALEAYLAAFALLGFTLRVTPDARYAQELFPRIVSFASFGETKPNDEALLFWHYSQADGPNIWIDDLMAARMVRGGRIERLFEGEAGLREAIVQADCFVEWHSNLSQKGLPDAPYGIPKTIEVFQTFFPNLYFQYRAVCLRRPFRLIIPFLEKLHKSLREDATRFSSFYIWLAKVLEATPVETRELLLGRFLWYLTREQASNNFRSGQGPTRIYWPSPMAKLVERAKEESKQMK